MIKRKKILLLETIPC